MLLISNPAFDARNFIVEYYLLLTIIVYWRNPEHGVNTKTLERIAKALNVEISDLFDKASDN